MSRELYFICASPGTSGNFTGRLIRGLLNQQTDTVSINKHTFAGTVPDILSPEFFYNNIQIPETESMVINVPFRPNYEILESRFPGCKIIVITHTLQEMQKLALNLLEIFFIDSYDFGAEPYFRKILLDHSHLFSNVNAAINELTPREVNILVKILHYEKLCDGFHCLTIPNSDNVLEIKHHDLYYSTASTKVKLENFTNKTFTEDLNNIYQTLVTQQIDKFFSMSSIRVNY